MKKVTASANILVDPRDTGWRKDIHIVAELLDKAATHARRMGYHAKAMSKEQENIQRNEAELKVVAKQLALAYPDLDMYFIESQSSLSFHTSQSRYAIIHATVRGGELSLEIVAEIGKEDDEQDY